MQCRGIRRIWKPNSASCEAERCSGGATQNVRARRGRIGRDAGRKKLIVTGISTDVCLAFPAISAIADGYSNEGNYDLVGNNTPVFFVRDPMKFAHFIRSQKRLPDSGLRDNHMQWDFWTSNPETAHQVAYLMGDRGLPRTWRHMNGYGSHTFMWINGAGEKFWVKYHFHTNQGMLFLTNAEAASMAGQDADFHRRDLFDAIARHDYPSWTLFVQYFIPMKLVWT